MHLELEELLRSVDSESRPLLSCVFRRVINARTETTQHVAEKKKTETAENIEQVEIPDEIELPSEIELPPQVPPTQPTPPPPQPKTPHLPMNYPPPVSLPPYPMSSVPQPGELFLLFLK